MSSTQTLLASALHSLDHSRKTQAEAGKSSICIIFKKLVRASNEDDQSRSIDFMSGIINKLDEYLRVLELDLAQGIEKYPIHGLLSAVRLVAFGEDGSC